MEGERGFFWLTEVRFKNVNIPATKRAFAIRIRNPPKDTLLPTSVDLAIYNVFHHILALNTLISVPLVWRRCGIKWLSVNTF